MMQKMKRWGLCIGVAALLAMGIAGTQAVQAEPANSYFSIEAVIGQIGDDEPVDD